MLMKRGAFPLQIYPAEMTCIPGLLKHHYVSSTTILEKHSGLLLRPEGPVQVSAFDDLKVRHNNQLFLEQGTQCFYKTPTCLVKL